MTRIAWILTALGAVLLGALWFLLLYSPTSEEIADVRADTDRTIAEAATLRQEAAQLRQVRENAPEAEAQIATGRALMPDESSMPSLMRQLQTAADESGVRLVSVAPSAPAATEAGGTDIVSIAVSLRAEGTYFQLVDMARRIEDSTITARGLKWRNAAIQPINDESYPILAATFSAQVYARSGFAVSAAAVEAADAGEGDGDAAGDGADQPTDAQPNDDPTAPEPIDGGGPEGEDELQ